jgi:hypothetical protein
MGATAASKDLVEEEGRRRASEAEEFEAREGPSMASWRGPSSSYMGTRPDPLGACTARGEDGRTPRPDVAQRGATLVPERSPGPAGLGAHCIAMPSRSMLISRSPSLYKYQESMFRALFERPNGCRVVRYILS